MSSDNRTLVRRAESVKRTKAYLGSLSIGQTMPDCLLRRVAESFTRDNAGIAAALMELASRSKPITLRGLFYRAVSAGMFPGTDDQYYRQVGRLTGRLRRLRLVPYSWIVDSLRSTLKPSSWSGLAEFSEVVKGSYRRNFWADLADYVHVFSEKDAIAATIQAVTGEYDVALSPCRGYTSESFAYEIGAQWRNIEKPIHAFYLGDFDPSGFDIERDLREKLMEHSGREFSWTRLGICPDDFERWSLVKLKPKMRDRRYKAFLAEHGNACAEIDALPPEELRRRVRDAIEQFIPAEEWARLQRVEALERETFQHVLGQMGHEKTATDREDR